MPVSRLALGSVGRWDPLIDLYLHWQCETISLPGEANNAILTKISLYIDLKLLKLRENKFTLEIFITPGCQSCGTNQRLSSRRKNASQKQVKCSCEIRPVGKWNLFFFKLTTKYQHRKLHHNLLFRLVLSAWGCCWLFALHRRRRPQVSEFVSVQPSWGKIE